MRTFSCTCGNTLFFENTRCVACGSGVGWCPACRQMTTLQSDATGSLRCGHASCGSPLVKCHNYQVHDVCNRCLVATGNGPTGDDLCDYCRFNDTIPDLTIPGNQDKWYRLEQAKRRLLYSLDLLGLPYGTADDGVQPPLSFDFKQDVEHQRRWSWSRGMQERVSTGHADGKITINLREADAVEREKARVSFNEAHRTLIGHFRHEIGHYFWQMLVPGLCDQVFQQQFGNHLNPTYAAAREWYYQNGPPADWQTRYISAYATMHPWEDFAETFAAYLDMVSVLDTALHAGIGPSVDPTTAELNDMVSRYGRLGIMMNELNRSMGLIDLVPEVFVPPVVEKLRFVHNLVRQSRMTPVAGNSAAARPAPVASGT